MSRQLHVLTQRDARTYLRIGITPREIVLLRWPDATDDEADFVLWECTPFPLVSGIQDIADCVADLEPELVDSEACPEPGCVLPEGHAKEFTL